MFVILVDIFFFLYLFNSYFFYRYCGNGYWYDENEEKILILKKIKLRVIRIIIIVK